MGILDGLFGNNSKSSDDSDNDFVSFGVIEGGRQKNTGGHDHRTNTGDDRTPAQKAGDEKRRKDNDDD